MNTLSFHRREFVRFLAASPFAAYAFAQNSVPAIPRAKDALNVMDFEPLARKALPPAHWGYLAGGVDDDLTLGINREAFAHYQLRARRLIDVSGADLRIDVFGATWDMPIYVSAVGGQQAFHPEGELATARAAKAQKAMQMLSTVTSTSVEDVAKALGTPPWYQLYRPTSWSDTEKLVKRTEAAGCPVIAWPNGSVPEVIDEGVSGFIVNDVDQAAAAVENLGGFDRAACRAVFDERFSVARMAADYVRVYEGLLQYGLTAGSGNGAQGGQVIMRSDTRHNGVAHAKVNGKAKQPPARSAQPAHPALPTPAGLATRHGRGKQPV